MYDIVFVVRQPRRPSSTTRQLQTLCGVVTVVGIEVTADQQDMFTTQWAARVLERLHESFVDACCDGRSLGNRGGGVRTHLSAPAFHTLRYPTSDLVDLLTYESSVRHIAIKLHRFKHRQKIEIKLTESLNTDHCFACKEKYIRGSHHLELPTILRLLFSIFTTVTGKCLTTLFSTINFCILCLFHQWRLEYTHTRTHAEKSQFFILKFALKS